jgi:hypothetical protein
VAALTDGEVLVLDGPDFLELVGGPPGVRRRLQHRYDPLLLPTAD